MLTLFFCVVIAALVFEYINGFHDAANAIATVVSTKVLTPRQAILLAAICNLFGALMGTAVAKAVGKDFVDSSAITMSTVFAALIGAIIWNLITWWGGIPSSSSHALVGGLCGAAIATSPNGWQVLHWSTGLWPKLVKPMFLSPLIGFIIGIIIMSLLNMLLVKARPTMVNTVFGRLQIVSAGLMGLSHGTNDAQKTMGIIALTLFTATTKTNAFANLPGWLNFLHAPKFDIPIWIKVVCAITMAAGTAAGGWRIIKTMGHSLVKMQPVHGFAAQTTAAAIIEGATHWGIPLSTTHVISGSIMGVGATKRLNAVKWGVVGRMVWAWVLTLPITALLSYFLLRAFHLLGWV